nr:MAG TPA: hypothetical protein [Caudoviricetes sp.]
MVFGLTFMIVYSLHENNIYLYYLKIRYLYKKRNHV